MSAHLRFMFLAGRPSKFWQKKPVTCERQEHDRQQRERLHDVVGALRDHRQVRLERCAEQVARGVDGLVDAHEVIVDVAEVRRGALADARIAAALRVHLEDIALRRRGLSHERERVLELEDRLQVLPVRGARGSSPRAPRAARRYRRGATSASPRSRRRRGSRASLRRGARETPLPSPGPTRNRCCLSDRGARRGGSARRSSPTARGWKPNFCSSTATCASSCNCRLIQRSSPSFGVATSSSEEP